MKKILLVEDDAVSAEILTRLLLLKDDHVVVWVDNGQKAWDLLTQGQEFDLIMSDHDMPEMSGVELLCLIRMDECITKMPFVLMSGGLVVSEEDQTPLEVVCRKYGAMFVEKPFFHYDDLVAEILAT